MRKTPLDDFSVDVAVFCLSLMGSNFTQYLREAHRVLKIDGHIHIWESESRIDDTKRFAADLERLGFQIFTPKSKANSFTSRVEKLSAYLNLILSSFFGCRFRLGNQDQLS